MIHDFLPIARVRLGLDNLKIISFGPRPQNFLACNAPIKQFDLFEAYEKHYCPEKYNLDEQTVKKQNGEIAAIKSDMIRELGYDEEAAKKNDEKLCKFAAYEATLLDWVEEHKGYRKYVALSTKCWVNSRLTGRGIPVSCEVDLYGALSEYIGWCISGESVTLLDINNSVPKDMYHESIEGKFSYPWKHTDTFMGFHCGNTCSTRLQNPHVAYQKIMANTHPADWCDGTPAKSRSTDCSRPRTGFSALMPRKAKSCRWRRSRSARSVFSRFRRWEDSTATS